MKLRTWLEAVLAVGLCLALFSFWRSHEALRDALAQEDVLKHEKADLQDKINAAGRAEKQANDALEALRKQPATIQTVTKLLPIPLPGQIQIQPVGPNQVPTLTVTGDPQANLQAIQEAEIKCKECQNSLKARDSQYADVKAQLAIAEKNAADWKKAAGKKTGFWANAKEWSIRSGFALGGYAAGRLAH